MLVTFVAEPAKPYKDYTEALKSRHRELFEYLQRGVRNGRVCLGNYPDSELESISGSVQAIVFNKRRHSWDSSTRLKAG